MNDMTNEQLHKVWEKCHMTLLDALREQDRLSVENSRLDKALALAIVNKDAAENQERLRRVEIDRLMTIIADAKDRFDDIASVCQERN